MRGVLYVLRTATEENTNEKTQRGAKQKGIAYDATKKRPSMKKKKEIMRKRKDVMTNQ